MHRAIDLQRKHNISSVVLKFHCNSSIDRKQNTPREYRFILFCLLIILKVRAHRCTVPYASLPVYRNNETGSDQPPLARDVEEFVYVFSLGLFPIHTYTHTCIHVHTSLMYPRTFFWYCKYSEINNRFYSLAVRIIVSLNGAIFPWINDASK